MSAVVEASATGAALVRLPTAAPAHTSLALSVIIPATDGSPSLGRCVRAIRTAADPPEQVVVVDGPNGKTPAAARNLGARGATGDVIVFVDSDVEVHADAFRRIRQAFARDRELAALFGSYDDAPGGDGVISQFRNLLHHHVHQESPGEIATFWAGLGAIRREAFVAAGGFVEHPIEDIELGMRLAAAGKRIVLDPAVQGKHLKTWTFWNMVRTDLLVRGAPWIGLALRHRTSPAVLNLGWRHRFSAASSLFAVTALALKRPASAAGGICMLLGLNRSFYRLLLRRGGAGRAAVGVGLHIVHHLTGAAAIPTGIALHLYERREATRR